MQHLVLPAPAKLNLFLHVLGRREDGYHNIQSVIQFIDFCDELRFTRLSRQDIELTPILFGVPNSENLIIKAAKLLQQTTGCQFGARITLNKQLPIGAGLGGGSSDAATTLLALNELWKTKLTLKQLADLGAKLGVDVPVFVFGYTAWVEGIGTTLSPIILPQPWYLLLIPSCHISTESLYQDPRLTRHSAPLTIASYQPGQGHNDFEPLVCSDFPEVAHALDWLAQNASSPSRMSGSGGVAFARFDTYEEAGRIAALASSDYQAIVAKGCNQSPLHTALKASLH